MSFIKDYELLQDRPTATSSAVYWKAKKDGDLYFLKRFNDPKRPSDRLSEAARRERNNACDAFARERKRINDAIIRFAGGNLIVSVDFFEYFDGKAKRFYQATPWKVIERATIPEIVALSDEEKLFILRTAARNVKLIHTHGVIHFDIKPDNLPISTTMNGKLSCQLIDFDSSHFEDAIPEPELVSETDPYMSPELAAYKLGKPDYNSRITTKNDVFALAIVFHQYWCGEGFIYPGSDSRENNTYLYNAVHTGEKVEVSPKIPGWLRELLFRMIQREPADRPAMSEVLDYLNQVDLSKEPAAPDVPQRKEPAPDRREPEPVRNDPEPPAIDYFAQARKKLEASYQNHRPKQYQKGVNFPDDAESFEVLPNGNIKIVYADGTRSTYNITIALRKKFITDSIGN